VNDELILRNVSRDLGGPCIFGWVQFANIDINAWVNLEIAVTSQGTQYLKIKDLLQFITEEHDIEALS
jgi:hypothetical protein